MEDAMHMPKEQAQQEQEYYWHHKQKSNKEMQDELYRFGRRLYRCERFERGQIEQRVENIEKRFHGEVCVAFVAVVAIAALTYVTTTSRR